MLKKIIEQQIQWAKAQNITLQKERPYTEKLEDNLLQLNENTREEFEKADGSELESKMSALRSSSALVVNVFDYWRDKLPLLAKALGIASDIEKFNFELMSPTGTGGKKANIDVVLETATEIIGIESKFTEWFEKHENKLKDAYFPKNRKSLWDEKGYSELHKLAVEMIPQTLFLYLDAAQLMKHILGLANHRDKEARGKTLKLIYLYYDCAEDKEVFETHKNEIATFIEKFKAEGVTFEVMSYQELFGKLQKVIGSGHTHYLQYLGERYFGQEK